MAEAKRVPRRDEIPAEYTWDLGPIFKDDDAWSAAAAAVEAELASVARFQGKLHESADTLADALSLRDRLAHQADLVGTYAGLVQSEDLANTRGQAMSERTGALGAKLGAALAFLQPEILSISEETLRGWLSSAPRLALYRRELEQIARLRPHTRSAEVEAVIAELSDVTRAPEDIYEVLTNAELHLPTVTGEDGQPVELSHGRLRPLLESKKREVREEAYAKYYGAYGKVKGTISAALSAEVRSHVIGARLRGYSSALEAALFPDEIPTEVYHQLVNTVEENLPKLHRYVALRKRLLGVEVLRPFDLYVPLSDAPERVISYQDGQALLREALAPLGAEYLRVLGDAFSKRWIDVYESQGKRSGAFSGGCYGTPPYILLNYQDRLDDAFTLAHELGHSMHSHLSRGAQPLPYAYYTTFVAEVASTVNETLVAEHLLRTTSDKALRRQLLFHRLEDIRLTLLRQTMFAEFELAIHQQVEAGEALTTEWLCGRYKELVSKHHGPALHADDEIMLEWARIPHFFYNFYVFQYATGLSAALALSRQLLHDGDIARRRYLKFLAGGSSASPIELLQGAGVDMTTAAPVQAALDLFASCLDELEASA